MGKRHLTNRQLKHLKHLHLKRLERAQTENRTTHTHATLGPEQPGLLVAHYGKTLIVENQHGHLIPCRLRQNLGTLVTGDSVVWQATNDTTGVVVAAHPRRSVITRFDKQGPKAVAANVDQMLILIAHLPLPQPTTLDRYLVVANNQGIKPLIGINKIDLLIEDSYKTYFSNLEAYRDLGYPIFKLSLKKNEGVDKLINSLRDHSTIVVGQSGVGKSSLLRALIPDLAIRTQALSEKNNLGQQTTTTTTLYHLPQGGTLLDSPGIHQFNLCHFTSSMIFQGFPEFLPFLGQCKFRNCEHKQEPGCALLAAVADGSIHRFRLDNYHRMLLK